MHRGMSVRRLAMLLVVGAALSAAGAARAADDWQANAGDDWKRALAAGRKEGKVVVAGHPALAATLAKGFERDTGITVEYLGGNPTELYQRLSREASAGNLTVDVSISGGAEFPMLHAGQLEPIKPKLMLPGVTDGKNWLGGQIKWMDKQGEYFFQGSNWVFAWPTFNSDVIKPGTITKWQDLLKPEYKGKIAAYDPRTGGPGQAGTSYLTELFGTEFVKQLYIGQQVTYTRDGRQLVEWAARGIYPIILCAVQFDIERYKSEGIKNLTVMQLEDGPGSLVGGFSVAKIPKGAPHPNAAAVFLNWYASQPGQEAYTRQMLEPSTRVDVKVPEVPDYVVPRPGAKYLDQYVEDWYVNMRPKMAKEMVEALGGR
jgi:ABC-type Fe3+ transport system substrate-binding protein